MAQAQTWKNCDYFGDRKLCPNREEILMKDFIYDVVIVGYPEKILSYSKEEMINKKYCNSCDSFKAKQ
jgi:hypothetical protein